VFMKGARFDRGGLANSVTVGHNYHNYIVFARYSVSRFMYVLLLRILSSGDNVSFATRERTPPPPPSADLVSTING